MADEKLVLPRRGKTIAPVADDSVHKQALRELGCLRLALEDMGDVMPRLTRLVVRSFGAGTIKPNDLIECRHFIAKIYAEIHFQHFSPGVDPVHINNSATKIREP